jgi:hypothetical protein
MSIVVSMSWPDVTAEDYEAAEELIRFDEDTPAGAISHTAWFTEDGLYVVDVWSSQEDFERFARERLTPATHEVSGFDGEPKVTFHPLHAQTIVRATAEV